MSKSKPLLCQFIALLIASASMIAHGQLRVSPASPAEGSTVTIYGMSGCMENRYGYSLEYGNPTGLPNIGVIKLSGNSALAFAIMDYSIRTEWARVGACLSGIHQTDTGR